MAADRSSLPHWDLSNVYPGLESEDFKKDADLLRRQLTELDELLARERVARVTRVPDDAAGVARVREVLEPRGYRVREVTFAGCLHLKTAVTAVAEDTLLVNPDWVDPAAFPGFRVLEVAPGERFAANVLRIGDTVIVAAGHPGTARRIDSIGADVVEVDVSELAKAEAGVTCCSVLLRPRTRTASKSEVTP